MGSLALLIFWASLALAFLAMTVLSFRLRRRTPLILREATNAAGFQGADISKLRPIFDEMLWLEFFAFLLTSGQTQLQQSLGSVSSSQRHTLSQLASLASPQARSGQTSEPFAQQFLQYTTYFVLGMGIGAGVTIAVVTLYRKAR